MKVLKSFKKKFKLFFYTILAIIAILVVFSIIQFTSRYILVKAIIIVVIFTAGALAMRRSMKK